MERNCARVLLGGTGSGCGKTTVTCALLQALVNRGLRTGAFKCGPDYIDPMFHSRIIGAKSANLDLFFFRENTLRFLLAENARDCDISIIEGVMGYYDGLAMDSSRASSRDVARVTGTPAVLVVDVRGLALSAAAVVRGFASLEPDSGIRGVILNGCTAMTYPALAEVIETRCGIPVLGYLPRLPQCSLESRHLGLVTAAEVEDLREKMQLLAEAAEKSLDIDGILQLARSAPPVEYTPVQVPCMPEPVRIAVAQDRAFCFSYADSLGLLEHMGAQLVPFSPLTDSTLPENIQGLYLCGGYPELYAARLGANVSMRESIRKAVQEGLPCIAECGGFLYLGQALGTEPMAGVLPGTGFDTGRLRRFGYVTLTARRDNLLCRAGQQIAAHEFHHWDSTENGDGFLAEKRSGKSWLCGFATDTLYGGFPHFHFYANPEFAQNFYRACIKEKHHAGKHQTNGY